MLRALLASGGQGLGQGSERGGEVTSRRGRQVEWREGWRWVGHPEWTSYGARGCLDIEAGADGKIRQEGRETSRHLRPQLPRQEVVGADVTLGLSGPCGGSDTRSRRPGALSSRLHSAVVSGGVFTLWKAGGHRPTLPECRSTECSERGRLSVQGAGPPNALKGPQTNLKGCWGGGGGTHQRTCWTGPHARRLSSKQTLLSGSSLDLGNLGAAPSVPGRACVADDSSRRGLGARPLF